ncbi:DsbA family protein [Shewanella sp. 5S214]
MSDTTLYYVHDPMCSWCWGYRPTWDTLQAQLLQQFNQQLTIKYLVGGLAPDSELPMPQAMQQMLQQTWHKIAQQLGTQFNHDFWQHCQPRRSTYLACRTTIVARQYGLEQQMINSIQQAYYLHARNPSDIGTLTSIATQLGIPADLFNQQLNASETEEQLITEINLARQLPIQGFPSLVLMVANDAYPIRLDYQQWQTSLADIRTILSNPPA